MNTSSQNSLQEHRTLTAIVFLRKSFQSLRDICQTISQDYSGVSVTNADSMTFIVGNQQVEANLSIDPFDLEILKRRSLVSAWWPSAAQDLAIHGGFVKLSFESHEKNRISDALLLTRLCNSLVTSLDALGVDWCDGVLHKASDFVYLASRISPDTLDSSLWINIRAIKNEDGSAVLYTYGMDLLERGDIEIDRFSTDPTQMIGYVCDLVNHLLSRDEHLNEDDLLLGPNGEKARVRVGESFVVPGDLVLKIDLLLPNGR